MHEHKHTHTHAQCATPSHQKSTSMQCVSLSNLQGRVRIVVTAQHGCWSHGDAATRPVVSSEQTGPYTQTHSMVTTGSACLPQLSKHSMRMPEFHGMQESMDCWTETVPISCLAREQQQTGTCCLAHHHHHHYQQQQTWTCCLSHRQQQAAPTQALTPAASHTTSSSQPCADRQHTGAHTCCPHSKLRHKGSCLLLLTPEAACSTSLMPAASLPAAVQT